MLSRYAPWMIWLGSSSLAYGFALLSLTPDGLYRSYMFTGIDTFYHATRILTTLSTGEFYEWDTRGFYPGGGWIAWPWGYDYILVQLSRVFAFATGKDPVTLLVNLPPVWVAVNIWLMMIICRILKLGIWATAFVAFGFAILPLTQHLHLAGRIDHHFMELTFVLATVAALTNWAGSPGDYKCAMICGGTLALAHLVNNGMFVLQLTYLAYLGALWLRDEPMPKASIHAFSATLLMVLLSLLIFSEPFQQGEFQYYLLSTFHLYVASATVIAGYLLTYLSRGIRNAVAIGIIGLVLAVPIIGQWLEGIAFVAADRFAPVETQPLVDLSMTELLLLYSPLLFLSPVAVLWLFVRHHASPGPHLAFCVCALLGLLMMVTQVRFSYYGTFALFIPVALIADFYLAGRYKEVPGAVLTVLALSGLFVQAQPTRSFVAEAWTPEYLENRGLFMALGEFCAEDPGLALVNPNQGHYVLYHTGCNIVANNQIISARHNEAHRQAFHYLSLGASALLEELPDVKYVLVRRYDGLKPTERDFARQLNESGLHRDLLGDPSALPSAYELISGLSVERDGQLLPLTRLYRINR